MPTTADDWHIKHMPRTNDTRRWIMAFKERRGLETIPEALAAIVALAQQHLAKGTQLGGPRREATNALLSEEYGRTKW